VSTDQASKDRAIAVLLSIAEDEDVPTEERAQAAQAVLMSDLGMGPETVEGIGEAEADAIREAVREMVKAERERVPE
jgi:hypothetical protein